MNLQDVIKPPTNGRTLHKPHGKVRLIVSHEAARVPVAAIIPTAIDRTELEATYKKLPGEARLQIGLARKWRVWAVLAPDWWAKEHADKPKAP